MYTCMRTCIWVLLSKLLYLQQLYVITWEGKTGVTHCNTLATHCNTLQHTATYCNSLQHTPCCPVREKDRHLGNWNTPTTHCNTLQHTATHYNASHAVTQQAKSGERETATHLQHTCNTLQHTCNTRQHTATQPKPRHMKGKDG